MSEPSAARAGALLWAPPTGRAADSAMARFADEVAEREACALGDYEELWEWSVDHPERFWPLLAEFFGVEASGSWTPMRERSDLSGAVGSQTSRSTTPNGLSASPATSAPR